MKEHWSDCAIHNGPALEPGPCDCDGLELADDANPQSGLTRPEKIALWFVSAAAVAILGFLFTLHGDVRALEGQYGSVDKLLGSMDSRIGEFKDRFGEFDRRFDQIDKGIAEVRHELGDAAALIGAKDIRLD